MRIEAVNVGGLRVEVVVRGSDEFRTSEGTDPDKRIGAYDNLDEALQDAQEFLGAVTAAISAAMRARRRPGDDGSA